MLAGIEIEKKQYTVQGLPPSVYLNGQPPLFLDDKVRLPIVESIDEPEEGGFLVWMQGQKYPRKIVLSPESLRAVCIVKKDIVHGLVMARKFAFILLPVLAVPFFRRWFLWRIAERCADQWDYVLRD